MDGTLTLALIGAAFAGWWLSGRYHAWRNRPREVHRSLHDAPTIIAPVAPQKVKRDRHVSQAASPMPVARALDPQSRRTRIRDRYVAARFSGLLRDAGELQDAAKVIKAARLYFEDDNGVRADELLKLAVAAQPHEPRLWLARLEILFLRRDAERFIDAARAFNRAHPTVEAWAEVARLGRALAPAEMLFRNRDGATGPDESYGPWPNTPNWIEAPWDLTAEVAGADFHRRMRARLGRRVESKAASAA